MLRFILGLIISGGIWTAQAGTLLICSLGKTEFPKIILNEKNDGQLQIDENQSCPLKILYGSSSLDAQLPQQRARLLDEKACLQQVYPTAATEFSLVATGFAKAKFPERVEVLWGLEGEVAQCPRQALRVERFAEIYGGRP